MSRYEKGEGGAGGIIANGRVVGKGKGFSEREDGSLYVNSERIT